MGTGLSATMSPAAMEFITGHLEKEFEGIYVVSVHATDAALIHTVKKPIRTVEDFKGMKLRVAGRFIGEAVKALGGTPRRHPAPRRLRGPVPGTGGRHADQLGDHPALPLLRGHQPPLRADPLSVPC